MNDILSRSTHELSRSFIKRASYETQLSHFSQTKEVIVVTWQRRTGKSSIVKEFIKDKNALYLNMEFDVTDTLCDAWALDSFVSDWIEQNWTPDFVVIDEIQQIHQREKVIRARRAMNLFTTIITWSNSTLLSGELATFLTGRYLVIPVYPLSYEEFLLFTQQSSSQESFIHFMTLWGLPEVALLSQKGLDYASYSKTVWNSIIYKDVLPWLGIAESELLERIASFLASASWFEISMKKIADTLTTHWKKVSLNTVARYVEWLEYALLLNRVPRYDLKGKRTLSYHEKFYFTNHGTVLTWWASFETAKGQILESLVYIHLCRMGRSVTIGKLYTKEIDFIATKKDQRLAVQVCLVLHENNREREIGNLEKLPRGYSTLLLTLSPTSTSYTETWIRIQSVIEWMTS